MDDMMKLTNLRASSARRGVRLTKVAGWILTVFGAAHVVIAPLESRDVWSQVVSWGAPCSCLVVTQDRGGLMAQPTDREPIPSR
jgi:hypothetical protein